MDNRECLSDFRRRYEGTFVWLAIEEKEIETLVYVRRVEDHESKVGILHLDSAEYGSLSINIGSDGHHLQFRYPPVGVFQSGNNALVFARRPARQYRRGLCGDNSTLFDVTRSVTGRSARWDASNVQAAFSHKVMTLPDALKKLESRKRMSSAALASNYAVAKSMTNGDDSFVLFHWTNPIARLNPEGKVVKLLAPMLEQRINTFIDKELGK